MKFSVYIKYRTLSFCLLSVLLLQHQTSSQQGAQKWGTKNIKREPAKIEKALLIVGEPVVSIQWPNSLKLVNIPSNIRVLNPGQCIRVGIGASGDGRDELVQSARIAFKVTYAGTTQSFPSAPIAQFRQIKPGGGDFVTQALSVANIENPMPTMYSLAVSADPWCAPPDAKDGTATIEAEADAPAGHVKLPKATVAIESYETGAKKSFKDLNELGEFSMNYFRQPNPARLVSASRAMVNFYSEAAQDSSKQQPAADSDRTFTAFIAAALKSDPLAAKYFESRISAEPKLVYITGLIALRVAGYNIEQDLNNLTQSDRENFNKIPTLGYSYDLTPDAMLYTRFDEMWAIFGATGEIKPIKNIANALAWRGDYEIFENARRTPGFRFSYTPENVRALGYRIAGWSIGSFQRQNPLAADYIDAMIQSADTPAAIKEELKQLQTNDAFKQSDGK